MPAIYARFAKSFRFALRKAYEEMRCYHDPTIAELATARERTLEMKEAGELRLSRQEKRELRQKKWAKFLERYPDYDAGH